MRPLRPLPRQQDLLLERDDAPIIVVPPNTWHCIFCQPHGATGAATTVQWIGPAVDGPHGRCSDCGQKYALARETWMRQREGAPGEPVGERIRHCAYCQPEVALDAPPSVRWRGDRGICARCGQLYVKDCTGGKSDG